jgi:hypothetical protein
MQYKIEKNIPLPDKYRKDDLWYYFSKMKKKDSVQFSNTYSRKQMRVASGTCCSYSRSHGGKFAVARYKGGVRIWRVK